MSETSTKNVDSMLDQHYIHPTEGTEIGIAEFDVPSKPGFGVSSGISQVKTSASSPISIINDGISLDNYHIYDIEADKSPTPNTFRTQKDLTNLTDPTSSTPQTSYHLSNIFFINLSSTYNIMPLVDNVKVYKISPTFSQIVSFGSVYSVFTTLAPLSPGDVIYATGPISISVSTGDLGNIPAYAGWAGYTFATTMDRNTVSLNVYTLDENTDIEIYYTTSSSSSSYNTSNLTRDVVWNVSNRWVRNTRSLTATRHYYIISNKPICIYRGVSQDVFPLYPMYPNEFLYGIFSQGGHVHSMQSAISLTEGKPSNNVPDGRVIYGDSTSPGNSTTRPSTSSVTAPYVYTDIVPPYTSGANSSGPACVLEPNSGNDRDIIISAESQADGSGAEMTPFIGTRAMGCTQGITTDLNYLVCISSSDGGFHIIDSSDNVVETVYLSGSATNGVYHGRTTKTSNIIKGNRFSFFNTSGAYTNSAYFIGDYGTSAKDETPFYMIRTGNFKEVPLTFTYYVGPGTSNPIDACSSSVSTLTTLEITEGTRGDINPYTGSITNPASLNTSFSLSGHFKVQLPGSASSYWVELNSSGQVIATGSC